MEEDRNNRVIGLLLILVFFGFCYTIAKSTINWEWGKRTHKKVMARRYGLKKSESLMNWVQKFCPIQISELYIGKPIHYIKNSDIIPYLGNPNSYPKDSKNRPIKTKSDMARAFNISDRVINRKIKEIENPKEIIGLEHDEYSRLKKIPPIFAVKIFNHLKTTGLEIAKPKLPLS